jgi:hypothetical protein
MEEAGGGGIFKIWPEGFMEEARGGGGGGKNGKYKE